MVVGALVIYAWEYEQPGGACTGWVSDECVSDQGTLDIYAASG